jgi:hypothetical protein
MPASKLAKLIGAREANHLFFREVGDLALQVRRFLGAEAFRPAVGSLLRLTSYEAGISLGPQGLVQTCEAALAEISRILVEEEEGPATVQGSSRPPYGGDDGR